MYLAIYVNVIIDVSRGLCRPCYYLFCVCFLCLSFLCLSSLAFLWVSWAFLGFHLDLCTCIYDFKAWFSHQRGLAQRRWLLGTYPNKRFRDHQHFDISSIFLLVPSAASASVRLPMLPSGLHEHFQGVPLLWFLWGVLSMSLCILFF